jgi:peptidoglycan/LPS O-acetylase OafA/YrhL
MTLSATSGSQAPATTDTETQVSKPRASHDPALDGLRGVAILMVFVFHYGGGLQSQKPLLRVLGYITQTGWVGVILFFALSGFLITGIVWDSIGQRRLLLNFYARRALRILPLYFVVLLAALIYGLVQGSLLKDLKPLWIYLFFLQNFPYLRETALSMWQTFPLYHLWSLAVEEQFYLIWPAILIYAENRRSARKTALLVFCVGIAFCICIWMVPAFAVCRFEGLFDSFLLPYAGALSLGGALALALRSRNRSGRVGKPRRMVQQWAPHAFWCGIVIYLLVSWYSRSFLLHEPMQYVVSLPAVSISSVALISIVLRFGLTRSFFSLSPLVWLGRISYGFYMFHIVLQPWFNILAIKMAHDWHGDAYQTDRLIIAFPITIIVSWLSYRFFELPILRLKRFFPMQKPNPAG